MTAESVPGNLNIMWNFIPQSYESSNTFFRQMVDAFPAAIYTTDAHGRLTYFNAAAVKLSGRDPELGTDQWCVTWKMFLPDGTPLPHDHCPMAVALRGEYVPAGIECMAERPDGTRFWFAAYPAVLRDAEGRTLGGINLLIDITARKNAELQADEQFRTIVETIPECVKMVSPDGTLLFMNSQGLGMLGACAANGLTGQNVFDMIAPEDRESFRRFNEAVCDGQKGSLEFDVVKWDGTRRRMETHAAPLRHAAGIVHLGISHDITERKTEERAAQLLSAIVDSSDDAIVSKDLNGIITSWNRGAERLFGFSAAEAVGRPVTILVPEDRLEEEPKILARLRCGDRVDHFETIRRRKDGTLLHISQTISLVRDKTGIIIGASKIARDITERKKAEAERKRIANDLLQANRELEQFAFSASHDLKEPLRTIKIYSELLTRECGHVIDGEAREYLGHLRTGATRMEMLVRDLVSYTQFTTSGDCTETTDSAESLKATLAGLSGLIAETRAAITADPLPSLFVHRTHLQQLFQNLIENAIKYRTQDKPPAVHVTAERLSGQWVFSISDNGIGIAPQYTEEIFGLFKRLHTSDEYSGTGIGLAICKRIVERYHGRIWVESEAGKGSTFRFAFPVSS